MKKFISILVPILVVAGVGAWYFLGRGGAGVVEYSSPETETESLEEGESYTGTLEKILSLGTSLKCSWKTEEVSGTSWVKGDQTYTQVTVDGNVVNSITKDNCVWSWSSGESRGVKVCYESSEELYTESEEPESEELSQVDAVKPPAGVEYNCSATAISDDKFSPPSNIEFMDLEDLMQGNLEDLQEQAEEFMPEGM